MGKNFAFFQWGLMFSLAKYGSPLITMYFYKKGYFAGESIVGLLKISTSIGLIVVLSYCIRGIGRSKSETYRKFINALEEAKANYENPSAKKKIRSYDFEFTQWPVDFSLRALDTKENSTKVRNITARGSVNWISPCSIAAFVAIRSFGLSMIYPGSIRLIQKFLHPMLVQGRAKLVMQQNGTRNKIETLDGNSIDTMFVDRRASSSKNGRTLVITAEGNAGFYEIGIMSTPVDLDYSVLGFNHPGKRSISKLR